MSAHWNVQVEDRVAIVTISNPPANALSSKVLEELQELLGEWEADSTIKAIVLTGEGRFFIAGADIKQFTQMDPADAQVVSQRGQELFSRLETFPKPIIAAINGPCLGGGLELALACHIRLAAAEAKLGLPELNLGLIPGYGGTQRLPRLVGSGKAMQMILTSDMIGGEEAHRIGLVEAVYPVEQLLDEAKKLAAAIANKSAATIKLALAAIHASGTLSPDEGMEMEAKLFAETFATEDAKEGVAAFLEKRKPQFSDR